MGKSILCINIRNHSGNDKNSGNTTVVSVTPIPSREKSLIINDAVNPTEKLLKPMSRIQKGTKTINDDEMHRSRVYFKSVVIPFFKTVVKPFLLLSTVSIYPAMSFDVLLSAFMAIQIPARAEANHITNTKTKSPKCCFM